MSNNIKSTDIRLMNQFLELLKRKDAEKLSDRQIREGLQLIMAGKTSALVWDDAADVTRSSKSDGSIPLTRDFMSQTMEYYGQMLKRHPHGGGWVPMLQDRDDESMPYVAETVYVGPWAMVFARARVMHNVRICDHARVCGRAYLESDAMVMKYGTICGTAWAINRAVITDYAVVSGDARLQGRTRVGGHAEVRGDALVCDKVVAGDDVIIGNVVKNGKTNWDKFVYDRK